MIKKTITLSMFLILLSCGNFELVLKDNREPSDIQNKVMVVITGDKEQRFVNELYSYFGNNSKKYEYILVTAFSEKKENKIIKKNQVAQKTDYSLSVDYQLYYENKNCEIITKNIVTTFSFLSKSSGYNFGADRSFEELYTGSVKKNIQQFVDIVPADKVCLKNEN